MRIRHQIKYHYFGIGICLSTWIFAASYAFSDDAVIQDQQSSINQGATEPLALKELIAEAIETNSEIKVFTEAVASAKGGVLSAKTWDNPQLAAGPSLKHLPGTSSDPGDTLFKGNFQLEQLILFPGKRSLQVAIAEKDLKGSELALEGMRHQITFRIKKLFYEHLALGEITKLREKQVQSTRTFFDSARKRARGGYGSDFEVVKSEAELISAQKLLRESQAQFVSNQIAINTLLGRPAKAELNLIGKLEAFKPNILVSANLNFALSQNPGYKAQIMRLQKAGLSVEASKLSRAPDLTVGPFVEYARDEKVYGVSVALPLPLWNTNQGGIASASAEQRKEIAETEKLRLEITQAVTTALENYNSSKEQQSLYTQDFLTRLKRAMEQAEKSYAANATTLLIYLDAKRTYFDSLAQYYGSLSQVASAYTELESAIGVPLEQN